LYAQTPEGFVEEILRTNFLSPLTLAFALGLFARVVKSEFSLPKDIYTGLGAYLLFSLGLKGGVELARASFDAILVPALVTLTLGGVRPVTSYFILRKFGKLNPSDSAGIAAHYGSVSAVTFIAALTFVQRMGEPVEGFLPTLLALLEAPGIQVALAIGTLQLANRESSTQEVFREILTNRTMVLLVGGLAVGFFMAPEGWSEVSPFFEGLFKGALVLFLLEMGVVAGARLGDLRKVGPFLLAFGVGVPLVHGVLGVVVGDWAGLSVGGATVLGTMSASASYIAAPPAVRMALPEANPTLSLTAALVITFPFNLLVGIPIYFQVAHWIAG